MRKAMTVCMTGSVHGTGVRAPECSPMTNSERRMRWDFIYRERQDTDDNLPRI